VRHVIVTYQARSSLSSLCFPCAAFMACSLNDLIDSQNQLVEEAASALPHEFSRCTYNLGSIRQAVYLCLTCKVTRGICTSCSIACHTDHEQVELFPKRKFRCDCPTSAIPHHCTLHKTPEEENTANEYGQNFLGVFCRCSRPYDPKTEVETMIQCLSCEVQFSFLAHKPLIYPYSRIGFTNPVST